MATEEPCASPTLAPEEPPASTTLATKEPPASPTLAPEKPPASTTLAPEEPSASPTLATAEPPASPTLAIEEPPASPEQELSDCVTNTSSSAYSCGTSSSSVRSGSPEFKGSLFGDTPSAQVSWAEEEEEEEEDLSPEEDTIMVIQQHLQGRAEALHNRYSRSLDTILRGRLTETPTMEKLQHLLEHIHLSLQSKNTQERARAVQTSAALLQFATSLPGFDTSSAFSKAGEFVLQLGLYISHPASDISRQARGGIYWLQRLLLQKRGLNTREAPDLWCWDGHQDPERLGYRNLARVGEVFGEIFTEDQKSSFLQAGLLAIHHPLLRVSQAGLVLTYSIVGEASQLLEDEEDITANIMVHLFNIRILGQVPEALQGLCSVGQH
ncbi:protein SON-like isoform X2 [Mauremys reevesii]|uniref:protein SON-like isoform X2 n=1 Tax=Mauremys reevesii TaxID=260615 RepID=UPI00193FB5C9|nr:protein SON-like isoform X2 [Mauremys reevesii]XP_039357217.1 protein SON-like isoform X2 [Mauremys reevesii]